MSKDNPDNLMEAWAQALKQDAEALIRYSAAKDTELYEQQLELMMIHIKQAHKQTVA